MKIWTKFHRSYSLGKKKKRKKPSNDSFHFSIRRIILCTYDKIYFTFLRFQNFYFYFYNLSIFPSSSIIILP